MSVLLIMESLISLMAIFIRSTSLSKFGTLWVIVPLG